MTPRYRPSRRRNSLKPPKRTLESPSGIQQTTLPQNDAFETFSNNFLHFSSRLSRGTRPLPSQQRPGPLFWSKGIQLVSGKAGKTGRERMPQELKTKIQC
ncbi:hypothetical protein NPIL_526051 [Nephila pilipes]|uniref:Uncharacterized protein n=1 Tax=Nephila pilipes TaxID=299642 RepID=A0A8X6PW02_NEPPI|nr:hypothetical protein NPIL_526051 [Nephila pilipes]